MGSLSSGHDEIVTINAANAVLDELAEEVRTDELPAATDSGASSSLSSSSSSSSSFPYLSSSSPSSTHPSLLSLPAVEESARVLEALEAPRGLATGFVQTLPTAHRRCCQTLVALDCEMVLTTIRRLELARISVVDERGRVLLDEFVKPHNAVKDYQTRFSGVTEEILRGVDTSLEQVQCALLGMIDASTVVVGHSLGSAYTAYLLEHKPELLKAVRATLQRTIDLKLKGRKKESDESKEDGDEYDGYELTNFEDDNYSKKKREVEREYFAPTVIAQPAAPAANGSIFQTSVGYTPLTSGARATTVGDIITIVLVERTQASKSNSADTSRSGSFGLTPPSTGVLHRPTEG